MESKLSILLNNKGSTVHCVAPVITVMQAIDKMNTKHVGAVLVVDADDVCGIFTERDVLTKVVGAAKAPTDILVSEVMTRNILTVDSNVSIRQAMQIMTEKRFRHLPVVNDNSVLGMISIGDLINFIAKSQETQIRDLENYIAGGSY